jgi:flagellar hook assembly protein FlgD
MAKLLKDQNALIRQDQRISMENRIGKKVQYQDTFFELRDDDNTVPIYYRLGRDAAIGTIKILDETGKIVQELQLDKKTKGDHKMDWDRSLKGIDPSVERAGSGIYFIQFEALDHEDKRVENIVELEGVVSQIDANEDGGSDYYIAGIKVDGRITKVSKAPDETASALKHLRSINPDYFSGKAITPDVQTPVDTTPINIDL